ncbi:MAG: hypothetical protein D6736_22200 [Nitrospinota bacterium]|nr:MAG: hypothetical protein D6736_22200 [Nitrospinota bacterium]
MRHWGFVLICLLSFPLLVWGGEADVEFVRLVKQGDTWDIAVTVRHQDTGWEHYADWWRVVTPGGEELGKRVLLHPHEDEQPFTRSLSRVTIPAHVSTIIVEAHDKVHGYGGKRITIDLSRSQGPGYQIRR